MRFTFCVLLFYLTTWLVQAQEYRFHQYRVEQGLPSDIIKAVTQDSLGFIWIATDDGLVKFDGLKFTTYKSAFRSQYTKGFLHTRNGRLLAFADLDLIEIQNKVDTVIFKSILKGERNFSDSATIWFPTGAYETADENIWIAEPKSVIRFDGTTVKRFDFGDENRSPVFVRSFSFFEDKNQNLYVVSFRGKVFRYNRQTDAFTEQENFQITEEVNQVLFYNNKLLVAGRSGLFSASVEDNQVKNVVNIFPINAVSNLLLTPDSTVLVSTHGEDLYRIKIEDDFTWENLYYNFKNIQSCYVSNERDIWVATDKGLVLVQKNLFELADINSQSLFVESITYDKATKSIYYCNKETLIKLKRTEENEWERNVIFEDKDKYFQCIQMGRRGLWASSASEVLLYERDKLKMKWSFAKEGNFIHDIFLDKHHNVWMSQGGSSDIKVITDSLSIIHYKIAGVDQNEINAIREGGKGMYAVASGIDKYLFFKAHQQDTFNNISLPVPFDVQSDFNIADLAIQEDILWLASSEGLLRYDSDKAVITRIDLGEVFTNYSVSSVECMDDNNILFSNSYGLFRYNVVSKEFWLYDENAGLPSNTITAHGIYIAEDNDVWIGTSYGIAHARKSITENKATLMPYCVDARVNGKPKRYIDGLHAPYGSYINLQFSAITFPENKINFQWRRANEKGWRSIENTQLSLSNLSEGKHTILVRAKKNTGLGWSAPVKVKIIVDTPYWRKVEFIFMVLFLIMFIAWASYAISSRLMKQRRDLLQNLVHERTQALEKANEELTLRNTELDRFVYSASHDLSAPLKSILGLIRVARMDSPGEMHVQYLSMMERSVLKLEDFIAEVVSYSRNTRMPVKLETFNFTDFVKSLLQDHQYATNFKDIEFIIEDYTNSPMVSDVTRIKIILNNLISNAIKFHWIENSRKPFVEISLARQNGHYVITVTDNGKGIDEKHLKRIFEMFYRASEEAQGSGLGLYILKESVTKLGGTVEARSILQEGTTFVITLPVPA